MNKFRTALVWFARPVWLFYLLPWLLLLLVLGTVAQRYLGLYHSEKLFFGSFILWIGPVPLPGAYTTLSFLVLALTAKLLVKSPIRKRSIGTVITHASIVVLLAGGLISAVSRQEGYITLLKGETSNAVSDYHDRELVILKNKLPLQAIAYDRLRESGAIAVKDSPLSLIVKTACYPCGFVSLTAPDMHAFGMAAAMKLAQALPNPDDNLNHAGAMIEVRGSEKQDGLYIAFESLSDPPVITVGKDSYTLLMRPEERTMPFSLQLLQFEQTNHPGTEMAKQYRSDVTVKDGELQWNATISMNEPLRYRGYTVYQSSFVDNGSQKASVLAVVKNSGWLFPYVSIATLCLGLLIHLFIRFISRKALLPVALAACILLPYGLHAEPIPAFDFTQLSLTPILHEGRIKPLDSFARALLKGMSGNAEPEGATATAWLAEVLWDPSTAEDEPLFTVKSQELRQALFLQKSASGRYSFSTLAPLIAAQDDSIRKLLDREAKTYSDSERELVHLYSMMGLYANLMGSLSLLAPVPDISTELRAELNLPAEGDISYIQLLKIRHTLMDKLTRVISRKHNNVQSYNSLELDLTRLSYQIDTREAMQRNNTLLRIIPGEWNDKNEWLSPWAQTVSGAGSPQGVKLFGLLTDLAQAWKTRDGALWLKASAELRAQTSAAPDVRPNVLKLEAEYNVVNPLSTCMMLYGLAVALVLLAIIFAQSALVRFSYLAMTGALVLQAAAVVTRMVILGRPPVSTLYESMLFVSFISAVCGMAISLRRKQVEGILAGSMVAVIVLFLADIFAGDGDTLEMLTAVLNTNFWLGTHVVCITAGYGFSLIAGVMAHIYLFRRAMAASYTSLAEQFTLLHSLALIALFFTTTGTMLGGIWADQSWGRFWGWDPKENGALAIVIWLIWALHGRVAGQLRETAFAAVLSLTTIVVAMAWVGVNLLSVGLHSYGFSDAAAWGLPLFCLTEALIVTMLAILSSQQYNVIRSGKNE